ncbi:MAG TPA: class I SAM-dependent methyltransferase [Candidatus Sulfotelmatobacter sp.]|nr:class I SAM-dependent methyltransferase [Candidatus Sulfotelmatobacter sp.]
MSSANPIRHISDTALWVAVYRAQESERTDAVFRDPYASKLAGDRGMQIAEAMPFARRHSWSYVARTWLVDQIVEREVRQGTDLVINLAAGLDSRPYRMQLPASLRWVEVDLPDILNYKQEVLAAERPVCALERVPLDLRDTAARRALFQRLGNEAKRVLVVSEGLIVYFEADGAAALACDLAASSSFRRWVIDLASPALLKMLQKAIGGPLNQAGSPLKFAPREGPEFFAPCGWKPIETRSLLHAAAKLKRLSFGMRLLSLLPDPAGRKPDKPWGGVCVFENSEPAPR